MAGTSAVWKSYDYTATSNQTSFSGNDDNSESLSYVAGFVQVFLNGILLDPAVDYTATTGSSIVLTSGASTGDLLQIESFTQIIGTGDILVDTFPVSSTQTAFTLSQDPVNKSNISVYVEGVYQESSTYSLSTTTLTLSESPANGTTVEVVIGTRNVTLDGIVDLTISGTLHAGALDLGDANIINVNEISLDTIKGDADANTNITFAGSDVTTFTQGGTERLRLNTTGAQVTGNIVVSGNVDGRDVAADGVTADAALPRAGGAMGGAITTNSTFDGRDVSVDGTKLDTIEVSATADQTDVEIRAAVESASDSNVFTNADHSKLDGIEASATADQTQTEINALGITALTVTQAAQTAITSVGTLTSLAVSGAVGAGAGTEGLPSLSFAGDTNTGIYSLAADNLGFSIGGTRKGFWSGTQFNVTGNGIFSGNGTFGGTLGVTGTISSGAITSTGIITSADFFKATGQNAKFSAGGTHVLNIDVNRKIYPNTHNSTDLGHSDTLAFRNLRLVGAMTGGASISSGAISATGSANSGSASHLPAFLASGNYGGGIATRDTKESGWYQQTNGADWHFYHNRTVASDTPASKIVLSFNSSGNATFAGTLSSGAITSSGAVTATGTDTQQYRLLQGTVTAGGIFKERTITGAGVSNDVSIFAESINDGGEIHFMTGGSATKRVTIDSSGNVGIGTSTPQKKFHVEHTAGASEGILISGASDTVGHTAGILLRAEGGEADSALRAKAGIFLERTATYGIGKLHIANRHNSDNVSATTSDANITIYDDKVGIGTTSPTTLTEMRGVVPTLTLSSSESKTWSIGDDIAKISFFSRDGSGIGAHETGFILNESENSGASLSGALVFGVADYNTAAAEAMRIDSDGNVGIGTSSPGAKLHVKTSAAGAIAKIEGETGRYIYTGTDGSGQYIEQVATSAVTRKLRIQGSNGSGTYTQLFIDGGNQRIYTNSGVNVGIGTTSPDRQLEISTTTAGLLTSSANRQGSVIKLTHNINHESGYTGGDFLGGIEFESGDGSAGAGVRAAIRAEATDPYNTHSLKFYTATSNSTSIASRMTIDHNGNVGIGTDSPAVPLHVRKVAGLNTTVELLRLDCGDTTHVGGKAGTIKFTDISVYNPTAEITAARVGVSSASTLTFKLRSSEVMALHNNGNVVYGSDGVRVAYFSGNSNGNATFSHDIVHDSDAGVGTVLHIQAAFTHHPSYDCILDTWVSRRQSTITKNDQFRRDTSVSGGFQVAHVSNTITRVTKTAGTYVGGGPYWIKATWRNA